MIYLNNTELVDVQNYNGYQYGATQVVPNIQKMMYAILELQQKLTEVSQQCDILRSENDILKYKVEVLDSMRN